MYLYFFTHTYNFSHKCGNRSIQAASHDEGLQPAYCHELCDAARDLLSGRQRRSMRNVLGGGHWTSSCSPLYLPAPSTPPTATTTLYYIANTTTTLPHIADKWWWRYSAADFPSSLPRWRPLRSPGIPTVDNAPGDNEKQQVVGTSSFTYCSALFPQGCRLSELAPPAVTWHPFGYFKTFSSAPSFSGCLYSLTCI